MNLSLVGTRSSGTRDTEVWGTSERQSRVSGGTILMGTGGEESSGPTRARPLLPHLLIRGKCPRSRVCLLGPVTVFTNYPSTPVPVVSQPRPVLTFIFLLPLISGLPVVPSLSPCSRPGRTPTQHTLHTPIFSTFPSRPCVSTTGPSSLVLVLGFQDPVGTSDYHGPDPLRGIRPRFSSAHSTISNLRK